MKFNTFLSYITHCLVFTFSCNITNFLKYFLLIIINFLIKNVKIAWLLELKI